MLIDKTCVQSSIMHYTQTDLPRSNQTFNQPLGGAAAQNWKEGYPIQTPKKHD